MNLKLLKVDGSGGKSLPKLELIDPACERNALPF
jgi:hypothetical protein